MNDRMILVGADDVLSGGRIARDAGVEMARAASTIQGSMEQHERFLTNWIQRFEAAVESFSNAVAHMN